MTRTGVQAPGALHKGLCATRTRGRFLFALVACLPVLVLLCATARADVRVNLLAALNAKFADAANMRLTQAQKIAILDRVGRDVAGEWVYSKIDTVITASNTEYYALNTDCAGGIKQAYIYRGFRRTWLQVVAGDQLFAVDKSDEGQRSVLYAFVVGEQTLGLQAVPSRIDTIILEYYAYPGALSGDSTEWGLPDKYEKAALDLAAAECWRTVQTSTGRAKADEYELRGRTRVIELKNPTSTTRVVGETPR